MNNGKNVIINHYDSVEHYQCALQEIKCLFETCPSELLLSVADENVKTKIKREREQILLIYEVNLFHYSMENINIFEKIKKKISQKYGQSVKVIMIALMNNKSLEDQLYLASQHECLFDWNNQTDINKLVYIDKNGVVQLITSEKGKNGFFMSKLLDEVEILHNIDNLVNNKRLLGLFSEKEINAIINQINEIGNEINLVQNEIKIAIEVSKYKEDNYIIAVYISFPYKSKEITYSYLMKQLEEIRKKGIIVKCINSYKSKQLLLKCSNKCYRCNHTIDPLTEYSYLCIKCKNKQYCKNCIKFFESFKKFGSQITILKEIEEFNTYLNNDIIDDLPCASHHLLMFIPPYIDSDFMDKYSFSIPTYIEYSSPSRGNNKCSLCDLLSCDKSEEITYPNHNFYYYNREEDDEVLDEIVYRELSVDNSLLNFYMYREHYQLTHARITTGYCPIFYCLVCHRYIDWECFIRFNAIVQLNKEEIFDCQYIRHNYDTDDYGYNEIFTVGRDIFDKQNEEAEEILNMDWYEDITKENILKIQQKGEIMIGNKKHKSNHPYIILQAKGIRLSYSDFK